MTEAEIRHRAIELRMTGMSYASIAEVLNVRIPKSTLSYWCRTVTLPKEVLEAHSERTKSHLYNARQQARIVLDEKKKNYRQLLQDRNLYLKQKVEDIDTSKVALAMLYLGEGSKSPGRGSLVFGNSDPKTISLFLKLLRRCYIVDENKFRCTVQCRADQDVEELKRFWIKMTEIQPQYFYKTRIDPRTIGKISRKGDYKGVCRIDYFSAEVFHDIMSAIDIITGR